MIYNFVMPTPSPHPDVVCGVELIWCQKDHTKIRTEWMRKGKSPEDDKADCNNPVAETTLLGEQLGSTGIPTLVFLNGRV